MDNIFSKHSKSRTDDGFLVKPFNSRVSNVKRWVEVMKIEDQKPPSLSETQNSFLGIPNQSELKFLKDLEKKLGFCLPKKTLDSVAEYLKEKLLNVITCSLFELNEFSKKIQKILERVGQFGQVDWKVRLGSQELMFHISEEGCSKASHSEFFDFSLNKSRAFKKTKEKADCFSSKIQDYSESIIRAFESCEKAEISQKDLLKFSKKSEFLIKNEVETVKRKKEELTSLKNSLEWQKEELRFYKNEAKHKVDKTTCQESILESEISNLREKRVSIAYGYENIEKAQEKLESQKRIVQEIVSQLQSFSENLGKSESDCPEKIKQEITDLEFQLKSLESELKKNYSQETLLLQINRLKTKISALKAKNAISATNSTTNSTRQKMNSFSKIYSLTKLPSNKGSFSSFCSPISFNSEINKVKSVKSKPNLISFSDRSLSASQGEIDTKAEAQVGQQQVRVPKRLNTTPDSYKLFKGNTEDILKINQDRQKRLDGEICNLEPSSGISEQKGYSSCSPLGDDKKFVEEKSRIQEQIEQLKEYLLKSLDEILNN